MQARPGSNPRSSRQTADSSRLSGIWDRHSFAKITHMMYRHFGFRMLIGILNKEEIRAGPQCCREAAAWTGGQNKVVVIGDMQLVEDRLRYMRLHFGEIGQELVFVGSRAIAGRNERDLGTLVGEVPGK